MNHLHHHERDNAELARLRDTEGLDVQLAYDGQTLTVDLPLVASS